MFCILSLEGRTTLDDRTLPEDRASAGSLEGRSLTEGRPSWSTGKNSPGWQEFAQGCCWVCFLLEDTSLEDAVNCTSLCVSMTELCVYVLCNYSVCVD